MCAYQRSDGPSFTSDSFLLIFTFWNSQKTCKVMAQVRRSARNWRNATITWKKGAATTPPRPLPTCKLISNIFYHQEGLLWVLLGGQIGP